MKAVWAFERFIIRKHFSIMIIRPNLNITNVTCRKWGIRSLLMSKEWDRRPRSIADMLHKSWEQVTHRYKFTAHVRARLNSALQASRLWFFNQLIFVAAWAAYSSVVPYSPGSPCININHPATCRKASIQNNLWLRPAINRAEHQGHDSFGSTQPGVDILKTLVTEPNVFSQTRVPLIVKARVFRHNANANSYGCCSHVQQCYYT